MKSRQKEIRLAPINAEENGGRSILRTSKNARDDDIQKLGKRLRKQDGVANVLIEFRSEFNALKHAFHDYVRGSTVATYAAARFLVEDKSSWAEFCRHREWRERKRLAPRVRHPEDALRASARIAVGFDGKRATRRASRLYRLLEPFFARKTPVREVASMIKEGGLKRLAEVGATLKKGKKGASKSAKAPDCRFAINNQKMTKRIAAMSAGTKFRLSAKLKKLKGGAIELIIYNVKTM
ncbi:hypothetical protein LB545_23495 [Mesorhizobium sp. BR1-1-6]|uniref:hypothetical protein n=1 Tax=Mesorhizobium sp. BR1-1-6 TaxID=2876648 RepID=UPI001CD0F1E1|nr:hypothetical protein [Mesorhizobium sp. BR1-1-6]MBZ9897284.1 hypothetical protein [Mesorhizobium sp. BR1-1-6]